jgi:hypothetical protein
VWGASFIICFPFFQKNKKKKTKTKKQEGRCLDKKDCRPKQNSTVIFGSKTIKKLGNTKGHITLVQVGIRLGPIT